jgi:hypothetical protein
MFGAGDEGRTGVRVVIVVDLGTSLVTLEVLILNLSESNHLGG